MTHSLDGRPSWKLLHRGLNVSANFAPKALVPSDIRAEGQPSNVIRARSSWTERPPGSRICVTLQRTSTTAHESRQAWLPSPRSQSGSSAPV